VAGSCAWKVLAGKLAQEFALVHAVLKGFVAIDEYDRNLVGKAVTQLFVAVDVYFTPSEAAPPL
jgi:hypothetical protein